MALSSALSPDKYSDVSLTLRLLAQSKMSFSTLALSVWYMSSMGRRVADCFTIDPMSSGTSLVNLKADDGRECRLVVMA